MNDAPRIEELLVVGRRVRIKLSPECTHFRQGVTQGGQIGPRQPGHFPEEDGKVGRLVAWPLPEEPPNAGHDCAVVFAPSFWVSYNGRLHECGGAAYAPTELIPLADDGTEILHPALARFER